MDDGAEEAPRRDSLACLSGIRASATASRSSCHDPRAGASTAKGVCERRTRAGASRPSIAAAGRSSPGGAQSRKSVSFTARLSRMSRTEPEPVAASPNRMSRARQSQLIQGFADSLEQAEQAAQQQLLPQPQPLPPGCPRLCGRLLARRRRGGGGGATGRAGMAVGAARPRQRVPVWRRLGRGADRQGAGHMRWDGQRRGTPRERCGTTWGHGEYQTGGCGGPLAAPAALKGRGRRAASGARAQPGPAGGE